MHLQGVTQAITWGEHWQIKDAENLLDEEVLIKRAHGFSDSILTNAERVLRLSQGK